MEVSHAGCSSVFAGNSTSLRGVAEDFAFKVTAFLPVLAAFFPVGTAFLPVLTAFSPYLRRRSLTLSRATQGGSKTCHNMSQAILSAIA